MADPNQINPENQITPYYDTPNYFYPPENRFIGDIEDGLIYPYACYTKEESDARYAPKSVETDISGLTTEIEAARHSALSDITYLTLSDRLDTMTDCVTPEMYGAAGDGSTDDTDAIMQAILSGLPVYFSAKTYVMKNILIENKNSINLVGNNTTLFFPNGINNKRWLSFVNCSNISVSGFTFNGNRENQTIVYPSASVQGKDATENCPAILLDNCKNAIIYNNTFYNCQGDGVQIDKIYYNQSATADNVSKDIKIYSNIFDKVGRNGVSVCHAMYVQIYQNTFRNIQLFSTSIACGIDVEPNPVNGFITSNVTISNNYLLNCTFGINTSLTANSEAHDIIVEHNYITADSNATENTAVYGIYILIAEDNMDRIYYCNNVITKTNFGFFTSTCKRAVIVGNQIEKLRSAVYHVEHGNIGIYFNAAATKIRIKDNYIRADGLYAIRCGRVEDALIENNVLHCPNEGGATIVTNGNATDVRIINNTFLGEKLSMSLNAENTNLVVVENKILDNPDLYVANINTAGTIRDNIKKRIFNSKDYSCASTDLEYTGVAINLPTRARYNITIEAKWDNSQPTKCYVSESDSDISKVVAYNDNGAFCNLSGFNMASRTLYVWAAWTNAETENSIQVYGEIIT